MKPEDFTYMTRIWYKAPSAGLWGEHEGVPVRSHPKQECMFCHDELTLRTCFLGDSGLHFSGPERY